MADTFEVSFVKGLDLDDPDRPRPMEDASTSPSNAGTGLRVTRFVDKARCTPGAATATPLTVAADAATDGILEWEPNGSTSTGNDCRIPEPSAIAPLYAPEGSYGEFERVELTVFGKLSLRPAVKTRGGAEDDERLRNAKCGGSSLAGREPFELGSGA
jgi:hypothetical protein